MSSVSEDSSTLIDFAKLDRILGQLANVNSCMDSHDQRLARLKILSVTQHPQHRTPPQRQDTSALTGGGHNMRAATCNQSRGTRLGSGGMTNRSPVHRDRFDDDGPPCPKIKFPHFDGESDPLSCLNKCDMYFRGMRTSEDEKVWQASLHLDDVVAGASIPSNATSVASSSGPVSSSLST